MQRKRHTEHYFEDIMASGSRSIEGRSYRAQAHRVKDALRRLATA